MVPENLYTYAIPIDNDPVYSEWRSTKCSSFPSGDSGNNNCEALTYHSNFNLMVILIELRHVPLAKKVKKLFAHIRSVICLTSPYVTS